MTHGSLFAGIDGFGLGFERAGFRTIWQVEKNKFCRSVLRTHFPNAKRFRDVRRVGKGNLEKVDVITAGVPCQDVSVAGKRAGLAGERTGLFYEFARILRELRSDWFVFENVPGLFSSNGGRDFAEVLRVLMVECGYGVSWRVLDSRYFGVAQRRRRVFLVGRFGRPCPAEILFDSASGERNFKARGEARPRIAAPLTHGSGDSSHAPRRRREDDENIVASCIQHRIGKGGFTDPVNDNIVAAPITSSRGHHGHSSERGDGRDNLVAATILGGSPESKWGQQSEPGSNLVAYALRGDPGGIGQGHNTTYAITENMRNRSQGPGNYVATDANALNQERCVRGVENARTVSGDSVRDGDVRAPIDADGMRDFAGLPKGMDSARYRALGNAVTVQVAEWIARRIAQIAETP